MNQIKEVLLFPFLMAIGVVAAIGSYFYFPDETGSVTKPRVVTECDGIRVYVFSDHGRDVYFTSSGQTQWNTGGKGGHEESVESK